LDFWGRKSGANNVAAWLEESGFAKPGPAICNQLSVARLGRQSGYGQISRSANKQADW